MKKQKDSVKWIWEMPSELNTKFRNAIGKKLGVQRGNIKKALEEAVEDWIKK